MAKEIIHMRNIIKSYHLGDQEQIVLKGVDLDV